jgi:sodium-dependent dicarboxylate transporter 2/3/5
MGFLEEHQLPMLTFGGWMMMMLPVVGLMLLLVPYLLSLGVTDESVDHIQQETLTLTGEQKRLYGIVGLLAFVLVLNTFLKQLTGTAMNEKLILLGFGLLMFMPRIGFLQWEDTRNIPYEIIFLFGAGFSIAAAFMHTGLAEDIAGRMYGISTLPFFWMLVLVALFVTFSTEVTSNTALTSIAIPIFYELSKYMPETQSTIILMTATVAASYAFMLPIATPPNAIVMSSRVIKIKEMAMIGLKLNIIGVTILSLVAYFMWGWML